MSLQKYSGEWTFDKAAHLLRRTTFGPTREVIELSVQAGMDATIEQLLAELDPVPPPVNFDESLDPTTPVGETWVDKPYNFTAAPARGISFAGWVIGLMRSHRTSITEKMVLFWHNHFAIADGNPDVRVLYKYVTALRRNAVGDFKQMTKDITIDPMMLRYLNGNENTLEAPNENYARELLELFTVGKGNLVGDGDYTTFTELDVREMARVLTGWKDVGYKNFVVATVEGQYRNARHDKGTKQLSHRFDNTVINNQGAEEYKALIDIIFESEHVATFICRKLYRWFVYYDVTDQIENDIIAPMAQILRDQQYNVKEALRSLLQSEHFYNTERMGCMIKSPLDFVLSMISGFGTEQTGDILVDSYSNGLIFRFTADVQMALFDLPSVAGWAAYHQGPSYYQLWLNSVTLAQRKTASDALGFVAVLPANNQIPVPVPIGIDALAQIDTVSDPYDINVLVRELVELHLPRPLAPAQYELLKQSVLNGLPDFEWGVEYGQYVADPTDSTKKAVIETKIRVLLITLMNMPEFQLM